MLTITYLDLISLQGTSLPESSLLQSIGALLECRQGLVLSPRRGAPTFATGVAMVATKRSRKTSKLTSLCKHCKAYTCI